MAKLWQIVEVVRDQPGISQSELADHLGVSARTVRSYMTRINDILAGTARISLRRGVGYALSVEDEPKFAEIQNRSKREKIDTSHGRAAYMLKDLLIRSNWVRLEEYAEQLFVSRQTLSHDLSLVEEILGRFNLTLERRPYHGMRVVGSEVRRRICLTAVVVGRAIPGSDFVESADDTKRIWAIVDDVIATNGIRLSSETLQNLVAHLVVAIVRIREGCFIPTGLEQLLHEVPPEVREAAIRIANRIGEEFSLQVPAEEATYIAIHLMGKQTVISGTDGGAKAGESISEALAVADKMLEVVSHEYHINLVDDEELKCSLAHHLAPLIIRLRWGMSQSNPLLDDIRREFPLALSIASDASLVLFAHVGKMPSADEVGYIALLFELALERRDGDVEGEKLNIVIACATGMGSAKLLEYRCRREFGNRIGNIVICDVRRLEALDYSEIDCVLSTVHIPSSMSIPVPAIVTGGFLGFQDVKEVNDFLLGLEGNLDSRFCQELFFASCKFDSKWDVIHFLCSKMVEHGASSSLEELVLQREHTFSTAVGNHVAIPHSVSPASTRTFLSVAILDEPLVWDDFGHEVRIVFLISFSEDRDTDLEAFLREFSALISNGPFIDSLVPCRDWDSFVRRMTLGCSDVLKGRRSSDSLADNRLFTGSREGR